MTDFGLKLSADKLRHKDFVFERTHFEHGFGVAKPNELSRDFCDHVVKSGCTLFDGIARGRNGRTPLIGWPMVAIDWTMIIAIFAACYHYGNPVVVILSVFFLGTRQHAIVRPVGRRVDIYLKQRATKE